MIALQGTGVSSGIASGIINVYNREKLLIRKNIVEDTNKELARWKEAVDTAISQLDELAEKARIEAGEEAASLFETHQMMLEDLDYTDMITTLILNEKVNAEFAVNEAGKQFAEMFSAMDDEYMKARSADVADISSRVISILTNSQSSNKTINNQPAIIVADDLTPSETIQLDKSKILGFILSAGNANSHTAILARTLGIPAIINTGKTLNSEINGRMAIMDGSVGYAVIDPDNATKEYFQKKQCEENAVQKMLEGFKGKADITLDGKQIKLFANITTSDDVDAVIKNDARGIGLFRSEFLYLQGDSYPTEDVQFEAYKTVVQRMNGQRVIIRTLDIGADKKVAYFGLAEEENPALGMRALRICLTRPEIFKVQLRALYRASAYGKLSIMFPMVASLWEVQEAKRICASVCKELKTQNIPFDENLELGVMIETPSAVMVAPELAKEVSFFSIGTNDLAQYTLAVDRQSVAGLERFYDAHHPAVLRMIEMTINSAHKAGIWAGICGEIASDLSLTKKFLEMGVDELSVSPRFILPLRNIIRSTSIKNS